MKDLLFAQGSIENVLKRIGVYKSNLFCVGEDPLTKSGVIVSNGEIVSSRILDVQLKVGGKGDIALSYNKNYINHIEVKYVDIDDKTIKTMIFNILSDEALITVIKFISEKQEESEKLQKLEKNDIVLEEKLKKIQEFLVENKSQIECIDDLKKQILDMNNKLDLLLTERALSKTI